MSWDAFIQGDDVCGVSPPDDDDVACQHRVGHGGAHEYRSMRDGAVFLVCWQDEPVRSASEIKRATDW